jgi:hypothetical protein
MNEPYTALHADDIAAGHEVSSVSRGVLFTLALGLPGSVAGAIAVSWIVIDGFSRDTEPGAIGTATFQSPGVEPNQAYDRQAMQQRDRQSLTSYGWADREHTVATIPIERAKALLTTEQLAGLSRRERSNTHQMRPGSEPVEAPR